MSPSIEELMLGRQPGQDWLRVFRVRLIVKQHGRAASKTSSSN